MMRRVPAAPPAHNTQRPAPALPSSSGRNGKFLRAALAALVVAACSILYYRANYGRTLAASLEAAPPAPREPPCRAPPPERAAVNPRVGIVVLADTASEARYVATQRYSQKSLDNKRAYAAHHGYELIVHEPAATLPAPWSKIDALLLHLRRFDWLLYLDGDALVANPAICLESFLDDAYDVVMAEDWGGYNTGAFLVRNSTFSRGLLRAMAAAATGKLDLARREPWYAKTLPFEFEQRALHYLTDTAAWRKWAARAPTKVPRVAADEAARTRSHIKVVPQCALNAYLVRPRLASGPSAKVAARAAYQPGDFVVHLAGHKGENKGALLDYALKHLAHAPPQGAPKCGVT